MTSHIQLLAVSVALTFLYCAAGAAPAPPETATVGGDAARIIPHTPDAWPQAAIERATRVASDVRDPYRRAEAMAGIARAQAVIGNVPATDKSIRQAFDASRLVPQAEFRGWVLHDIVLAQIAADDIGGARQVAERIEAERPQGAAVAAVAEQLLRRGDLAGARASASRIREEESRSLVLRQIVAIEASRGLVDAANATATGVDDAFYGALAYGDIAVAEVRRGELARALAQASRARRSYRGIVFGRIAAAQLETGDIDGAIGTVARIGDDLQRGEAQARLAALRAAAEDRARAQKLFGDALATIGDATRDLERVPAALATVGRLQAVSGYRQDAKQTLLRAHTEASALASGGIRDGALDSIARGQARIGEGAAAVDTAKLVSDRSTRALLIRDVVSMLGDVAGSGSIAQQVATIGDPLANAAALFGTLGSQLSRRDHPAAGTTIEAARRAVRGIEDVAFRPAAFAALAAAEVTTGDVQGGREIFEEALAAAEAIEHDDRRAAAYVRIVDALNDRLVFLGQPMKKPGEDEPVRH